MDQQLQLLYNDVLEIESHIIYIIVYACKGYPNPTLHPIK